MATCLARRACVDRKSFRLYKDGKEKFTIFTEFRCPNPVEGALKVCQGCSNKLPMHKYQSNQKCDHGLVGGPYPADSKLYGSPYYLNCIKNGFTILEADECRAKEAMSIAGSTMPKKTSDLIEGPPKESKSQPELKQEKVKVKATVKKIIKVKTSIPVIETPAVEPTSVAVIKPIMVESTEAPITVEEIIRVKVKKVRHQGKDYYFDRNSCKLYVASANGVGKYAGRYNEETNVLNTSYPDSDEE